MQKTPLRYHEIECCDAVIRHLEEREGFARINVTFPERQNHSAPVEVVFNISDTLYAIEHTGIEPFEGHMKLSSQEGKHFDPVRDSLKGLLPQQEHFVLHIDALAFQGRDKHSILSIQAKLMQWILKRAEHLPTARLDAYWSDTSYETLEGTSIHLSLHRVARGEQLVQ